jgi:hypothetical protein
MEFDNHVNTCCFGANFTAIQFTEHTCDVMPFSDQLALINNVPIASAAIVYDDPVTGYSTILIFHQGLWFRNQLSHSLINPNGHYGIEIRDDPYFDPHWSLAIWDPVGKVELTLAYMGKILFLQILMHQPMRSSGIRLSGRL